MTRFVPEIIYEDDHILAINKPAGLVVHPDGRTDEPSVSAWLLGHYPQTREVGEPLRLADGRVIDRPGVVHRIDRDTSGVLLLAKTQEGFECLKSQFQERELRKYYHLFVYGLMKDDRGTINLQIGKSSSDFRKWSAERGSKGVRRDAITYFEVLKRDAERAITLVEAQPKTGRTHQLRVHFKALHHPVVADRLYAPRLTDEKKGDASLDFERLALHARSINFKTVLGEQVRVEAPYPADFLSAMDKMGNGVLD
jgi:23S rRNA pseudouridine1911/1915/1917 synthase